MLSELPDDLSEGVAPTQASNHHLFNVSNENVVLLDIKSSEIHHHNVVKVLFLCKHARPDLQTAIAFLCTRVKATNTDDYKTLHRVMKYVRGSRMLVLTLEVDNRQFLKLWVNASLAVHPKMCSHAGGVFSMAWGCHLQYHDSDEVVYQNLIRMRGCRCQRRHVGPVPSGKPGVSCVRRRHLSG